MKCDFEKRFQPKQFKSESEQAENSGFLRHHNLLVAQFDRVWRLMYIRASKLCTLIVSHIQYAKSPSLSSFILAMQRLAPLLSH